MPAALQLYMKKWQLKFWETVYVPSASESKTGLIRGFDSQGSPELLDLGH